MQQKSNSSQSSGTRQQASKKNGQNGGNRRKNPHHKKRFSKGKRPGGQSGGKHSNRNRYTSKLTSIQAVFSKYDNLLENYLNLRSKYFDYFFKDDSKQRKKVVHNYESALQQLRNFTKQLSDYQKEQLEKRHLFKLDTTYSQNRNLDPSLTEVSLNGNETDIHLTKEQLARPTYKDDSEESIGTIEDYQSYKGL